MRKIMSILACGALLAGSFPLGAFAESADKAADDGVITIATAADMVEFSKNCNLDTYSKGKTFVLTDDIDLTKSGFENVPYFAGNFDGGGHTITGLRIKNDGSVRGLFRTVAESGRIKDLTVTGRVTPTGTRSTVGGIAGENSGEILRCKFEGTSSGVRRVGGIAGVNTESGIIKECEFSGDTKGEHSVGGIAGENRGTIVSCTNSADVNAVEVTVTEDKTFGLSGLSNLGSLTEMRKDVSEVNETTFLNISDIGGIAGLSSGTAEDCVNRGIVGYDRMGYNVGGIVGRSSGKVRNCRSEGTVLGRKDVGGIAGQIEPYAHWDFSESKVTELENDIDELQKRIDNVIDNSEDVTDETRQSLIYIRSEMKLASEEIDRIREQASGDMDAAEKSAEELKDIISEYADKVTKSAEELDEYTDDAKKAISSIASGAAKSVQNEVDSKEKQVSSITKQVNDVISGAEDDMDLSEYSGLLSELAEKLKDDPNNQKIAELMELLKEVSDEETSMHLAIREQVRLIREELSNGDIIGLVSSLKELKNFKRDFIGDERIDRMLTLMQEIELPQADISSFESYVNDIERRAEALNGDIDELISVLSQAEWLFDVNVPSIDTSELTDVLDGMSDVLRGTYDEELVTRMRDVITDMNITVPDLNELFDHLKNAKEEAAKIADKATTDDGLAGDINSIRDQFSTVLDRFSGTVEDVATVKTDYESDISDSGNAGKRAGTVVSCENSGDVRGDNNVGGIAGAMAYEIDIDPEDTLDLSDYLLNNARYLIYTVIDGSTSTGAVTAKKECAGGIVGLMDFGVVSNSTGAGTIKVENGDYCGGTAGKSFGTIKNSYSRAVLEGGKYVGGIAGRGSTALDCLVYSFIDGAKEYSGSVVGYSDTLVKGCAFVENGLGGIDGVSIAGSAEPLTYDEMLKLENVPDIFKRITLTFIANDETVAEVEVPYGGSISELPEVEKDGVKYWKWDDFNKDNIYYSMVIHGEYTDPIRTLATEEEFPLFLAEGIFYEGQSLTAEPAAGNAADNASYTVSVNDTEEPLKVRFRTDIKKGRLTAGGKKLKYETDGSYIVFKLDNGGTFAYQEVPEDNSKYVYAGAAGGVCITTIIVTAVIKKRRKAKTK